MDQKQSVAWVKDYFSEFRGLLGEGDIIDKIVTFRGWLQETHKKGGITHFIGNGGSSGIASHCATDFSKNAGIRSSCFSDAAWLTCLANDYGYPRVYEKSLALRAGKQDLVVLISSSGQSENILRAADWAKANGNRVVAFTGFKPDNPLRKKADLEFYVPSMAYNRVENIHQFWILTTCDLLIGAAEYSSSREL